MNKTIIKKIKLKDKKSDFQYWQSQPFEARLETLEKIREEYIGWKYDNQPRFQRFYSITKQK